MKEIKRGDEVTPTLQPELKGKVVKTKLFFGEIVYVLDNGTMHTRTELNS